MDTVMKPVQNGRGRRRQWSSEQKLTVLQEWQAGVPLEEICRKYAVNAAQMYPGSAASTKGSKNLASWCRRVSWAGYRSGSTNSNEPWDGRPWKWTC